MWPLIDIITGLFALIMQMIYFIKDDRTNNNDPKNKGFNLRWHIAGGILHVWMYYIIHKLYGVEWGLLMAASTWLLFDGFINSYALKKEFWYIGATALIDKFQQWVGKITGVDPRGVSAFLKLSFFIGSITSLYLKYRNG